MKAAKIIAWICLLAMTLGLINGFVKGDFFSDGAELMANPWGVMSMIDLYVGFTLFSLWILYREEKLVYAIGWVILMMVLGFFTGSLYVLIALYTCNNDMATFFMGHRKERVS